MSSESRTPYAHLPEDLIKKMLEAVPRTVGKMENMLGSQDEPIEAGIDSLRNRGIICKLGPQIEPVNSIMAADGGQVIERMSGMDLLLAVAVGVEGLHNKNDDTWTEGRQYEQWQTVMPHDEATPRLCQGAMFLMELGVLADATHEIRIMDGAHFTPLLKINSMLSAREEHTGEEYVSALRNFLSETYEKIIPDIPDMISSALNNPGIIAMAKYSSSRDILDSHVKSAGIDGIAVDDKTFFALALDAGEYTKPMSVGQSEEEKRKIWNDLHIKCNLEIEEKDELNNRLEDAISSIRTKNGTENRESALFFSYFKPHANGPAYRIECKRPLAKDVHKFECVLAGIKRQIVYPDIREPFPQYLADLMAKSVSGGLHALQDAVRLSLVREFHSVERLDLLFSYRSS